MDKLQLHLQKNAYEQKSATKPFMGEHLTKGLYLFICILLMNTVTCGVLNAQVEDTLCRHFIVSIDKYPDNRAYLFSANMMECVSSILERDFLLNEHDFVSISYYGIKNGDNKISDFISIKSELLWMSGSEYKKKWRRFPYTEFSNYGELPFSIQDAAKECSFLACSKYGECNQTYILRVTDNKGNYGGNKLKPIGDVAGLMQAGSPIGLSEWQMTKDSVTDYYTFEKPNNGIRSFYSINGQYGVYIDHVVPKDRPSIGSVVDIKEINVRQVRGGQRVSFKYRENENYSLERICISYLSDKGWGKIYDTVHMAVGDVDCVLEDISGDTLKLNIKVWGTSRVTGRSVIISPYDETVGGQLQEERTIHLKHAKVFGIPLTKGWLWFSDNAELTALIWMLILVALAVGIIFLLYYAMRIYRISSDNIKMKANELSKITIDLLNKEKASIAAATISIDIEKPSWSKGRIIREDVVAEVCLNSEKVSCIETNGMVFFLDKDKENKLSDKKNITIKDYKTDLQLNIDPNAIVDCIDPQTEENCDKEYDLQANVALKKNGTLLTELPIIFKITFNEIRHQPQAVILNEEHNDVQTAEVQYSNVKNSPVRIGSIGLIDTIKEKRKPVITSSRPVLSCTSTGCAALSIKGGDVVLDMSQLNNPTEPSIDYKYRLDYCYREEGYDGEKKASKEFVLRIKRNDTAPQLRVWVKDKTSTEKVELKDRDTMTLSDVHFIPGDALSQFWSDIVIENSATQGRTGSSIKVTGVQIIPEVTQPAAGHYADDKSAFVRCVPAIGEGGVVMYNLDNGPQITVKVGWNATGREVVYTDNGNRRYDFTVRLTLKLTYQVDAIGNQCFGNKIEYKSILEYKVHQDVHREWLGVDFGTSAIVAQYGNEILNLRVQKEQLYQNGNYKGDTYEIGTEFLSSNVIFRQNEGDNNKEYPSTEYGSAAICLSPTSTLEKAYNAGMLPCLKLMVGYDQLPVSVLASLHGQGYTYQGKKVTFGEDGENPLVKVMNVFREVYRQLIRDFILPLVDNKPIDNVALTVPNTYTSMHLGILEECIKKSSIGEKVRNIHFVSESDAVACYYQSNWTPLNCGRTALDDEYVLVFDMGAGTTDVSLIHRLVQGGNTILQVIGKVGIGCAGNYLDTVLAETIASNNPDEDLEKYLSVKVLNFKQAAYYKQLIKDVVKPLLNSSEDEITLSKDQCELIEIYHDFTINLEELRDSEKYQSYIKFCTSDFLDNFFNFLGYNKQDNRPRIDTLVLSGRASNQRILIEKLKAGLTEWCGDNDMKIVSLWEGNHDASKTAVIEGAVNYVSRYMREDSGVKFVSSNITADYGITFQDATGATKYMLLLSHDEEPSGTALVNGVVHSIYHRDFVGVDLHTVNQITLIQAYTKTPVGADGSLNEYTTVIETYHLPNHINRQSVTISIDIDEVGQIYIAIDGAAAVPQAATHIDLNNEIYKKGLWPMLNE